MMPLLTLIFAKLTDATIEEIGLAIAMFLTLAGTLLHWQLPRKRMSFEESVKDSKMTEDQAMKWIKFYTIIAPVLTFAGIAVLAAVLLGAIY